MEDTQKLTHMRFLNDSEGQLIEDFFSGRGWDSRKQVHWNRMESELFPAKEARIFANVVVALNERGWDLESSRFAAGQATMFRPGADYSETLNAAADVLEARKAA